MLQKYKTLIDCLPLEKQAFATKRNNWPLEQKNKELKSLNDQLFDMSSLLLSREDIFVLSKGDIKLFIIGAIYWGYPNGMRGYNFSDIISNLDVLASSLSEIRAIKEFNNFEIIHDKLSTISGLGLSTYSTFLYFLRIKINNLPALILDSRIIRCIQSREYSQLLKLKKISYSNAPKHYYRYLEEMYKIAVELDVATDKLELFLFQFGGGLKH